MVDIAACWGSAKRGEIIFAICVFACNLVVL